MFYARMYKNTFTNTFQTMTSVDYENISDYVFTRIFFFQLLKKLQVLDLVVCILEYIIYTRIYTQFLLERLRQNH